MVDHVDRGSLNGAASQASNEHVSSVDPLRTNPLRTRPKAAVMREARKFHRLHKISELVEEAVFVRGALVAYDDDPLTFDHIEGATEIEKACLKRGRDSSVWKQMQQLSKESWIILCACIFAATTQGWDQSSMNGANLRWPEVLNVPIESSVVDAATTKNVWIFSLVNASTFFSASFVGCWLSDPLNEHVYGRRGALFIAGIFSFSTVIGAACVHNWKQLLATRILLGFGMGAKASVVPIFLSETAPRHIRGSLVLTWQLFDTFGIWLGFTANCIAFAADRDYRHTNSWRYMLFAACIPALLFLILVPFCIESPRWLLKKGRYMDALKSWISLHSDPSPIRACAELYLTHAQLQNEAGYFKLSQRIENRRDKSSAQAMVDNQSNHDGVDVDDVADGYQQKVRTTSFWARFRQLFIHPRMRRASICAFCIMTAQQLCGFNILAFLSSTIFASSFPGAEGQSTENLISSERKVLWMSFGFGLGNFLFTICAIERIDTKGRRFMFNLSFPNMTWTLLAAGLALLIDKANPLRQGLFLTFLFLFTLAYSIGEGPSAFIISSEVFPLFNREVGMSFAVFWNLFMAGLLSLFVPILAHSLGETGLLCLFSGLNLIAWAACYFLVPETANLSLENINYIFETSTAKQVEHRRASTRWWLRKHVLRKKDEPEPLPLGSPGYGGDIELTNNSNKSF